MKTQTQIFRGLGFAPRNTSVPRAIRPTPKTGQKSPNMQFPKPLRNWKRKSSR